LVVHAHERVKPDIAELASEPAARDANDLTDQ
jgi:hypothetical protein